MTLAAKDPTVVALDALIPAEMAAKAEQVGAKKAHLPALSMFVLSVLAGAFIALGAVFSTLGGLLGALIFRKTPPPPGVIDIPPPA